jgi:serine/threonine protein kinase
LTVPTPSKPRFRQAALASGLVTQQDLDQALAALREDIPDFDGESVGADDLIASKLVELGRINRWQADQLLSGRMKWNLGPYRILDQIGQGGMGQVFKAEHSIMRRLVAIKVLPLHKQTDDALERFRREIQAQAQLDHPNLVRAYDAGQDGNVHFLVTEFVPGMDLRRVIKTIGPLGMHAAAAIICQAARGLEHAHSRGLIHRDVKPGNLLVTPEGVCKVSDLGLAGFVHEEDDLPSDSKAEGEERMERRGKIVGTADYLSPEQILSPDELTPACDVYALGCTLYYAVTAKVPFPGGTSREKARRHCYEQPLDPRRLNNELDNAFVDVIADMMLKDPDKRIASMAGVIPRLRPWAGDDWPATVVSGCAKFSGAAAPPAATPPPLPSDYRPLNMPGAGADSLSQWSQGTYPIGSEETMPFDSQAGFYTPHTQPPDRLSRAVVIAMWLAVAVAVIVFALILLQTLR